MTTERRPAIEFAVRPFDPSDQERVRWLFARTPPWGRTYPRPQQLPDDLEDIPANYPGGCFVAVEEDLGGEAIIGLTAVATLNAAETEELPGFIDRRPSASRIHWVSVAPERWRLGVGRRLTETAIAWARDAGHDSVILSTTIQQEGAIALYESLGFAPKGKTISGRWHSVWLELVLDAGSREPTADCPSP